jgi:transcriptional regulator with XRE-family HTH domain
MKVFEEEAKLNKIIGNKLHKFRKVNSIRKKELCRVFNISTQQLNKYESGVNRISAAKLYLFFRHYGIVNLSFFEDRESKRLDKISELFYNFSKIKNNEIKKIILGLMREITEC